MNKLPKLCLLVCGGTITMTIDPKNGTLVPSHAAEEIIKLVPELSAIAKIDTVFIANIDSTNVTPNIWFKTAKAIEQRIDQYDGFIVTHGTDTMAYSASALSFLLQGLSKPVIFTGSQAPITDSIGSDAKNNLLFSATFATQDIAEVCIFFGTELLRGNRTRKFSQFDFDAFKSFNLQPLGKIGIRPKLFEHCLKRNRKSLVPVLEMNKPVFLLKYFPGLQPEIIHKIIDSGYAGLVIEGVGDGNLPSQLDFASEIRAAAKRNVPIVVTTQCIVGAAEMYLYEVGKFAEQSGAISGLDLTPEAALTKLMWALTQTQDLAEIRRLIQTNLVGELSDKGF